MVNDMPEWMSEAQSAPQDVAPEQSNQEQEHDREITAAEAAELLGVKLNNFRQYVHKGKATVIRREGRKTYYSANQISTITRK